MAGQPRALIVEGEWLVAEDFRRRCERRGMLEGALAFNADTEVRVALWPNQLPTGLLFRTPCIMGNLRGRNLDTVFRPQVPCGCFPCAVDLLVDSLLP